MTPSFGYFDTDFAAAEYTKEVGLWPVEVELVSRHFPAAPAAVLDLGCGAGRTTRTLADLGYCVAAIDLSNTLLIHGQRRFPELQFIRMDATCLGFKEESFDAAIFSFNGIDHLCPSSSRLDCMAEVFRVLRPGGIFFLSTHNVVGQLCEPILCRRPSIAPALRFIREQGSNPMPEKWYVRSLDQNGELIYYAAPPRLTRRQLAQTGFKIREVRGHRLDRPKRRLFRSMYINFVAEKPASRR